MNPNQLAQEDPLIKNVKMDDEDNDSGDDSDAKPSRRSGRRKIKIEYIEDKNRRHITFSKRKAGIMKKAYELSTLTGTQVLLLVVSETGLVYTFTTVKLQPIVTKPEGKNLIQACLNAPDPMSSTEQAENEPSYNPGNSTASSSRVEADKKPMYEDTKLDSMPQTANPPPPPPPTGPPSSNIYSNAGNNGSYQQHYGSAPTGAGSAIPPMAAGNYGGHPSYINPGYHPQQQQQQQQQPQQQQQQPNQSPQQQSPQQPQQQQPYGQLPAPGFYGSQQQSQQPHYMPHPQQQQHGYWSSSSTSPALRQQEDEKARRGLPNKN